MRRFAFLLFVLIVLSVVSANNLRAEEDNPEILPAAFSGLRCFDTPFARVYSKNEKECNYAVELVTEVAEGFERITKLKPQKGIIIVVESPSEHPVPMFLEICKKAGVEYPLGNESELKKKGLTEKDIFYVFSMMPTALPYVWFQAIAGSGQKAMSVSELKNLMSKNVEEAGDRLHPWILCLPTEKCMKQSTNKIFSKAMRAEMGLAKYMLLKPLKSIILAIFSDIMLDGAKGAVFETWLKRVDITEEEKKSMKEEYTKQTGLDVKGIDKKMQNRFRDFKGLEGQDKIDGNEDGID